MLLIEFEIKHCPTSYGAHIYGIYEYFGKLKWVFVGVRNLKETTNYTGRAVDMVYGDDKEFFNSVGYLASRYITEEQSELLTGLYYPASMDRLIEMVAEHYEPAYPVEVH